MIGVFAFYNYRVYNTQYHEWLSERNELALKIRECSEKADVLDENVVFVTESGDRFHSYGCQYIRGKSTTHWFVEDAIREGYLPCSVCREENMFWIQ